MEERQARIETSNPNFYTLIDLEKGKAYMVNTEEKQLMAMNIVGTPLKLSRDEPSLPKIKAELIENGEGPKVAGYTTINYQVVAEGKVCSENYFSLEAMKVPYVKAFLDAMYQMSSSRKPKGLLVHPCQQAHDELEARSMKLGVPMKSIIKGSREKGDKVKYEIIRIQTDVNIPENTFTLPKKYQLKTEAQLLEEQQAMMNRQEEEQQGERVPSLREEENGRYDDRYRSRRQDERYDERYYSPRRQDERYMPPSREER
ncbi:MAG: hypothetical protein HC877_06995 [Thioploca sp.]|nr:hypothetical protein [Thioploca sp.]